MIKNIAELTPIACADPDSLVRGGPSMTSFFFFCFFFFLVDEGREDPNSTLIGSLVLVDEGREDPYTTIIGPSLGRQRNAI